MASRSPAPEVEVEEKRHRLLHSNSSSTLDSTDFNSSSIDPISSSPTPASFSSFSSYSSQDDEQKRPCSFEFDFSPLEEPAYNHNFTNRVQQQPRPQRSWRQTPLTVAGLTNLAHQVLLSLVLPLLPSFLFSSAPRHLHSTSHLDGLRGLAALTVLLDHFVLNWYYPLRNGYLSTPADSSVFQLPIIRLLFAGRASVAVFFAISGFVLAYKPLKLIRANNKEAALNTLSSSIFRRGIRLYVPIILGTLISAYLAQNAYYTPVPARTELLPPQMPTMKDQLHHWYHATLGLLWAGLAADPNKPFPPAYNGHLWTIPIEFFGSMVVFLAVLGTARAGSVGRMCVLGGLASWALGCGRWDVSLFVGGAVIAEGSLVASAAAGEEDDDLPFHYQIDYERDDFYGLTSPLPPQEPLFTRLSTPVFNGLQTLCAPLSSIRVPFALTLLALSLYLLSYAGESPSPGLYHAPLSTYAPRIYNTFYLGPEHFFLSLGALMLVALLSIPSLSSASLVRTLQRPLLTPVAQYLGDISYALYIVHGMVLFTLGTNLQERWTGQVGEVKWVDNGVGELVEAVVRLEMDDGAYWRAFWMCAVANGVVVFWVADLFWRAVDGRVVKWGRCAEGFITGVRRR